MKRSSLITLIAALSVILLVLLIVAGTFGSSQPGQTDPTDGSSASDPTPSASSSEPTGSQGNSEPTATDPLPTVTDPQPTQTEPKPTETEPQPTETEPTEPLESGMYTRAELEAMPTTEYGYGPGRTSGGARAPYAVAEQSKYSQYAANFIGPDDNNVYLTFDCGYEYTATDANGNSYRVTEKILDVLKEKNVKAVFFVTMYYVKENPDLVQRMIDEGHAVGNHSNNHPVMPEQTIDKMIYEVTSLHDYVKENFGYEMHLFRHPTGAFSVQSLAVVQNLGYKNVHWSFAYGDYDTANQPDYDYALDLATSSHHNGAIYLLHAISETNAAILGDLIDFLRAEGYNIALFN